MTKQASITVNGVNLPRWNDAASVTAFGMTLVGYVLSALTYAHITVPANVTASTSVWVGLGGFVVASVVGIVNAIRVVVGHKAAVLAAPEKVAAAK